MIICNNLKQNSITVVKSRRMKWEEDVARMGQKRNEYKILVDMPEGKKSFGRPRRRWEGSIRMDLRETG
jgi:hypothetical protein